MGSSIFARTIKTWFQRNRWAQNVPEKVAHAKNHETGPWGSQISHAMNAKHTPQPNFFLAMGWFNFIVATRDYENIDTAVVQKLRDAMPLCHDNGEPFDGPDFFKLYVGLLEPPAEFRDVAEITQEDVDHWQNEIRLAFREIVMEQCTYSKDVWLDVKQDLLNTGISPEDVEWCQEMIFGLRNASVDEARRQRQKYSDMPLLGALQRVAGGDQKRLGKLQSWLVGKAKNFPEAFPKAINTLSSDQMRKFTDNIRIKLMDEIK